MFSLKKLAIIAMLAPLLGCDSRSPDNTAREKMNDGRVAAASGEENGRDKAAGLLTEAANTPDASSASIAQAKAVLGQVQYESGLEKLREANRKELAASQIALQIAALGAQLGNSATLVEGYRQRNPQSAQAKIKEKIDEATGSPDKPRWFADEKITIASLTAAQQEVSRVQGEISKRQSEITELDTQRKAALEESETAMKTSDAAKGDESVAAFKQASEARKKAADLQAKIDMLKGQLMPLEKDLAMAANQQHVLEIAIKELDAESKTLEEGWKEVQAKIDAQKELMKAIAEAPSEATSQPSESPSPAGKSIAAKATMLAQRIKEADEAREAAKEKLSAAAATFDQAFSKANEAGREMQELADKEPATAKVIEITKAVLAPQTYKLRVATADRALADMQTGKAAGISARIKLREMLSPIMEKAGLKLPPELADITLEKQLTEALADAETNYASALEQLDNVTETRGSDAIVQRTQKAGALARIFVLYGQQQLALLAAKPKQAQELDAKARDAVKAAADLQVSFPNLPGDLASAIPPPPAPTAPTPEATTAPAEGTAAAPDASADPEVAAIRITLNSYVDALQKGDADAAKALCQVEPGQEEILNKTVNLFAELKKFTEASQAKFGLKAAPLTMGINMIGGMMRSAKITVKGDEGFASIAGSPEKKQFVKVDGQWKVYVYAPDAADQQQSQMVDKMLTVMPQITSDIQAGKYATIEDLSKAFQEAMGPMPGAAPPPGPN